ncbi:MAG: hypothetical protein NTU85_00695 [Candidatus Kaiserbacteria bacterium]|nr:hypothetical protein [Candidatus Kaiserbacteria bacterium]
MFGIVLGLVVFFVFGGAAWYFLVSNAKVFGAGVGVIALGALALTVFSISPNELGYGHVPQSAEEYTKRLDAGVVYRALSSHTVGVDRITLISRTGTSKFYAIRVKDTGPLPEKFTLVNGNPVALQ